MEEREIFVLDLSCLPFACINGFREHDSRIERLEQIVASHVPAMGMGSKTDSGADGGVGGDDGSTIVLKENAPTDLEAPCDPSTSGAAATTITSTTTAMLPCDAMPTGPVPVSPQSAVSLIGAPPDASPACALACKAGCWSCNVSCDPPVRALALLAPLSSWNADLRGALRAAFVVRGRVTAIAGTLVAAASVLINAWMLGSPDVTSSERLTMYLFVWGPTLLLVALVAGLAASLRRRHFTKVWRALVVAPYLLQAVVCACMPYSMLTTITQSLVGNFKRDWPPPAVVPLLIGIIHGAVAESVRWKVRVMVEGHATVFLALCVMAVRIEWLAGGALPMDFWSTFFYKFGARCVVIVFGVAAGLLISEELALHRANRA